MEPAEKDKPLTIREFGVTERWLNDEPWHVETSVLDSGSVHIFAARGLIYETPGVWVRLGRPWTERRLARVKRKMERRAAKLNALHELGTEWKARHAA